MVSRLRPMKQTYPFVFRLLLLLLLAGSLPVAAQNILVYAEDFESGPTRPFPFQFQLNTGGVGSNTGPNQWIVNNQYSGASVYPNTPRQDSTTGGEINFAPFSNYLHIHDPGAPASNASFNASAASDRFTETNSFCTLGLDSVRIAFFVFYQGNPSSSAQLYYSSNGGSWTPVPGGIFTGSTRWKYVEYFNEDFDHVNSLRFGFRWTNTASSAQPAGSIGIDGVRIVGKYSPVQYGIRLEIDSVGTNPVCRGHETQVFLRNPVPLCGVGFYEVQLSNEFGDFTNPHSLTYQLNNLDTAFGLRLSIPRTINNGSCYRIRVRRVDTTPFIISDTSGCIVVETCPNTITTLQPAVLKVPQDTLCLHSVIDVPFNSTGVYINNTYIAQLSDSSGAFPPNPNVLGTSNDDSEYPSLPGTVSGLVKEQNHPIPPGCNYYIRVIANSPFTTGTTYGPFCIRHCDMETNRRQDIQLCIDEQHGADTVLILETGKYEPPANYSAPNSFQVQLLDYSSFSVINTGVVGEVVAVNDTAVRIVIPPLPQLSSIGIIPGNYYMRIVATGSDQPWDQLGTLVRLTIGAPRSTPLTIHALNENFDRLPLENGELTICFLGGIIFHIDFSQYNPSSSYTWGLNNTPRFYEVPPAPPWNPYNGILFNSLGTYRVYVVEENYGCTGPGSNTIVVNVKGPPNPTITGPFQVCEGDTVKYSAILTEDTYYFWNTSPGTIVDSLGNEASISFPRADSSVITLNVVNECRSSFGSRTIRVRRPPAIETSNDTICVGTSLSFSIPTVQTLRVYWMQQGEVFSNEREITLSPDSTTTYTVRATSYSTSISCEATDTFTIYVQHPVSAKQEAEACTGQSALLEPGSVALSYEWSTGELSETISVTEPGWYYVVMETEDMLCVLIDSFYLKTKLCYQPFVLPNVFSPNNDSFNDVFTPQQSFPYDYFLIEIFNRWGLKVFESGDPFFKWSGHDMNGNVLPDGTYFYIATLNHENESDEQKGFLTILH